jgi:GNAT superfamily N-acetyltransferase
VGASPRPFTVRRGTIRDLQILMRHRLAMERELGRGRTEGLADFERAYRRWLAERIRARRLIPFFAVDPGGHPFGSGSIWLRESRPHRGDRRLLIPRVHGVYVEPRARRQGIATRLVEEMLGWARRQGYRRVTLRTTPRAEAIYVRFGFHHISEMQREWAE